MRSFLRYGNVVAGAAAEGHGILVGWRGHGELTRTRLLELIEGAGAPSDWAPEPKNPPVQLSRAVENAAGSLYNPERVVKKNVTFERKERRWSSKWMLVKRATDDTDDVGGTFGDIVLVATLFNDKKSADGPELVIKCDSEELKEKVRADYNHRIQTEQYTAADITQWLADTLKYRLQAIRYGGNYFVPRNCKVQAATLCDTLMMGGWGTSWIAPPIPIATTPELQVGLAMSLQSEVAEVTAELIKHREAAQKEGRSDISESIAISLMMKYRSVGVRILEAEPLLGAACLEDCKLDMHDAMVDLDRALSGQGGISFDKEWLAIKEQKIVEEGKDPNGRVQGVPGYQGENPPI